MKKVRTIGIWRFTRQFPEIHKFVRMACAMSLLPKSDFEEGLAVLRQEALGSDPLIAYLLEPFFNYINDKWIGNQYRRNWMRFFGSTQRTNNACESHNRTLRRTVGPHRPNMRAFIEALKILENNASLDIELQNAGGRASRSRRWSAVANDRRLQALSNDLALDVFRNRRRTLQNFLHCASHTIENLYTGLLQNQERIVQQQQRQQQ